MSTWKCSGCDYNNDRKQHVERHINKLKRCGQGILKVIEVSIDINCDHCQKQFTSERSLKRHIKNNSKVVKSLEILKRDIEIQTLKDKLAKAESKSTIINMINPTIIINGYQHTSWEHLKDKHYQRAISKMIYSVPTLIKDVHFSSRAPENHNIYISNIRGKYAMVWDGHKWEARDQDETIDKLIMDNEYAIEEWLDEDKFPQEMKKFNEYLEKKESPDLVNGRTALDVIREEVKLVLYNNRNLIKI